MQHVADHFFLSGERSLTNASGVGFDHSHHGVDPVRRDAGAGAGASGGGVGAGDKGIGPVIDIKEGTLGTLEQNLLLGLHRLVEVGDCVDHEGLENLGGGDVVGQHLGAAHRLTTKALDHGVVLADPLGKLLLEDIGADQISHAQPGAGCLVTVSRADAALGGADLVLSLESLAALVERTVVGHHQVGAVADQEILINLDAALPQTLDLLDKCNRVNDDAVADDADLPLAENAGRDQVEDILLIAIYNGVAGVVTSLAAYHDVDPSGQDIDDFSFAFIPPLGSYENGV